LKRLAQQAHLLHNGVAMNKLLIKSFVMIVALAAVLVVASCASNGNSLAKFKGQSAETIYAGGAKAMRKHHYATAIKHFSALEALYPFGSYAERAQMQLIKAYYKHNDLPSALAAADRYIRLYPRSKRVDYAYYMKGVINMGRGETWIQHWLGARRSGRDLTYMKLAFLDFREMARYFPHSKYTPDAIRRMIIIRNTLAQHNLDIAEYYMKMKAYVGAANRANLVVRDFPSAPQVKPALQLMVKAYQKMGEPELATQTEVKLQRYYRHLPQPHDTSRAVVH